MINNTYVQKKAVIEQHVFDSHNSIIYEHVPTMIHRFKSLQKIHFNSEQLSQMYIMAPLSLSLSNFCCLYGLSLLTIYKHDCCSVCFWSCVYKCVDSQIRSLQMVNFQTE